MDLISIIIPYYKKKKFIKKTLKSVLNQSYKKIEVIIIYDDNSYEDLDYIKKLKLIDKRIILIINKDNLGAGNSRNKGINISRGKYLAFIDSDDIWHRNKLKIQYQIMKNKGYKITHTSYKIIDHKGKVIGNRIAREFNNQKKLLKSCDIGLSTVMLKKKILIKNIRFAEFKTKEDFILWLKILKKGIIIKSINSELTNWRKLENSLSSETKQKISDGFKVYNKYMKFNYIKSCFYLLILSLNYLKKNIKL